MAEIFMHDVPANILKFCQEKYKPKCLCFTKKIGNSSVQIMDTTGYGTKSDFPSLQHSVDNGKTWLPYDGHQIYLDQCENGKMYIKAIGSNPNGMHYDKPELYASGNYIFLFTGFVECTGNIQYLLKEDGDINSVPPLGFASLFSRNPSDGQLDFKGSLPATELAARCYYGMFSDCTSLTQAPELPATTLADSCYSGMFHGCTSLTAVPQLPATTLADSCYAHMFGHCTSLTQAPELPATTLADECYYYMFARCASLTAVPQLPATTLAESCYWLMFYDCAKLKISENTEGGTIVLNLPSTTAAKSDWNLNMFTETAGTFTGSPSIGKTYRCYN